MPLRPLRKVIRLLKKVIRRNRSFTNLSFTSILKQFFYIPIILLIHVLPLLWLQGGIILGSLVSTVLPSCLSLVYSHVVFLIWVSSYFYFSRCFIFQGVICSVSGSCLLPPFSTLSLLNLLYHCQPKLPSFFKSSNNTCVSSRFPMANSFVIHVLLLIRYLSRS